MFNNNSIARLHGGFHVAELAQRAKVTPATIRYYSRVGLLDPGREPENGYRSFSLADLRRVNFVRQAQAFGLTIGDIKSIMGTVEKGDLPCHQVRSLVERRLTSIRNNIAQLQATEGLITHAMESWEQWDDLTPTEGELCPLIERVDTETGAAAKAAAAKLTKRRPRGHACNHQRPFRRAQGVPA